MLEGVKYRDLARFSYSQQQPDNLLKSRHTLAVLTFDGAESVGSGPDPRLMATGLRQLGDAADKRCEVWTCASPVSYAKESWGGWASSSEYMFCSVDLGAFSELDIEQASFLAYTTLLRHTLAQGFPHILRAWNYFPRINLGDGDSERYKQFCSGRFKAYADANRGCDETSLYPAACAIGNHFGSGCAYILAGKYAGKNYENPHQQSAFKYPRKYGPHSPSFARATVVKTLQQDVVFVSGTASIRGNETISPCELTPQLKVSFENIDYLLAHIRTELHLSAQLELDVVKVYVRDPQQLQKVSAAVEQHVPKHRVIYLEGDICRADLEVEIDGLCYISNG